MIKVTKVIAKPNSCLYIELENGLSGEISIDDILWGEIFTPLKDQQYFKKVYLDDQGIINWPNGADVAPEEIYRRVVCTSKKSHKT
jgi:hypothetical protein